MYQPPLRVEDIIKFLTHSLSPGQCLAVTKVALEYHGLQHLLSLDEPPYKVRPIAIDSPQGPFFDIRSNNYFKTKGEVGYNKELLLSNETPIILGVNQTKKSCEFFLISPMTLQNVFLFTKKRSTCLGYVIEKEEEEVIFTELYSSGKSGYIISSNGAIRKGQFLRVAANSLESQLSLALSSIKSHFKINDFWLTSFPSVFSQADEQLLQMINIGLLECLFGSIVFADAIADNNDNYFFTFPTHLRKSKENTERNKATNEILKKNYKDILSHFRNRKEIRYPSLLCIKHLVFWQFKFEKPNVAGRREFGGRFFNRIYTNTYKFFENSSHLDLWNAGLIIGFLSESTAVEIMNNIETLQVGDAIIRLSCNPIDIRTPDNPPLINSSDSNDPYFNEPSLINSSDSNEPSSNEENQNPNEMFSYFETLFSGISGERNIEDSSPDCFPLEILASNNEEIIPGGERPANDKEEKYLPDNQNGIAHLSVTIFVGFRPDHKRSYKSIRLIIPEKEKNSIDISKGLYKFFDGREVKRLWYVKERADQEDFPNLPKVFEGLKVPVTFAIHPSPLIVQPSMFSGLKELNFEFYEDCLY